MHYHRLTSVTFKRCFKSVFLPLESLLTASKSFCFYAYGIVEEWNGDIQFFTIVKRYWINYYKVSRRKFFVNWCVVFICMWFKVYLGEANLFWIGSFCLVVLNKSWRILPYIMWWICIHSFLAVVGWLGHWAIAVTWRWKVIGDVLPCSTIYFSSLVLRSWHRSQHIIENIRLIQVSAHHWEYRTVKHSAAILP